MGAKRKLLLEEIVETTMELRRDQGVKYRPLAKQRIMSSCKFLGLADTAGLMEITAFDNLEKIMIIEERSGSPAP